MNPVSHTEELKDKSHVIIPTDALNTYDKIWVNE